MMTGNRCGGRLGPQRLTDEQAVHPRKHEIQHEQIGRVASRTRDHARPGGQSIDDMARPLEIVRNQVGDVGAVFDQKDAGHSGILMNL